MDYKWNVRLLDRSAQGISLNPCFNGLQMEHTIRSRFASPKPVLILVLMDYKWNWLVAIFAWVMKTSLNPCFNGIQMERFVL